MESVPEVRNHTLVVLVCPVVQFSSMMTEQRRKMGGGVWNGDYPGRWVKGQRLKVMVKENSNPILLSRLDIRLKGSRQTRRK